MLPNSHDGLTLRWSPVYQPQWDETPQAYVDAGIVGVGRSRRLARAEDRQRGFKAYLGIQHWDPSRWNLPGDLVQLTALAQQLRKLCGAGGSLKDGNIELQGDHRDKVEARLVALGYKIKRVGG